MAEKTWKRENLRIKKKGKSAVQEYKAELSVTNLRSNRTVCLNITELFIVSRFE